MAVIVRFRAIVVGLAIIVTGCSAPPTTDVDAAKTAVDKAAAEGADRYAPESLQSAQAARAALDAERGIGSVLVHGIARGGCRTAILVGPPR